MVNWLFPLFNVVDGLISGILPPLGRALLWGAVAGSLSVAVYALLSPQEKIRGYREKLKEFRGEMIGNEELDFSEYMAISGENLKTAMLFFSSAIGPALASAVPVILILIWIHTFLGYTAPEELTAKEAGSGAELQVIRSPERVTVMDGGKTVYRGDPLEPPVPSVTERRWWNLLVGNPAGYLQDGSDIESIRFNVRKKRFLDFMPDWGEGVEFPYFLSVFITALLGRLIFRIR